MFPGGTSNEKKNDQRGGHLAENIAIEGQNLVNFARA